MDGQAISLVISGMALTISAITAWATLFRRGTVRMTRPSLIAFCPKNRVDGEKVFLRTLLYSNSKRGSVIETMYAKLKLGKSIQNFDFWGYKDTSLVMGSGLHVGEDGCAYDHHFVLREGFPRYEFLPGDYDIEIYATLAHSRSPALMSRQRVSISSEQADEINNRSVPIVFHWDPELGKYQPRLEKKVSDLNALFG